MDDTSIAYEWAKGYDFDEEELYYMTLLALKILDGHCKMDYDNYNLFMSVYDGIADKHTTPFTLKVHEIIEKARANDPLVPTAEYKEVISSLRKAMMENMSKDSMKAFKKLVWSHLEC